jgi:hypothetical protein
VLRVGDRIDAVDLPVLQGERCASAGSVSMHANVEVAARATGVASKPPVPLRRAPNDGDLAPTRPHDRQSRHALQSLECAGSSDPRQLPSAPKGNSRAPVPTGDARLPPMDTE